MSCSTLSQALSFCGQYQPLFVSPDNTHCVNLTLYTKSETTFLLYSHLCLDRLTRHQTTSKIDFRSCLMINLGHETDGNNEICLGVRFALCVIKALRLARIEHCSGTVVTHFLLPSLLDSQDMTLCEQKERRTHEAEEKRL